MKGFLVLVSLIVSSVSFAAVENVVVSADLEVSKCTSGTNTSSCDESASMGTNRTIALSNCSTTNGSQICSGSWTKSITRDNHAFDASIDVTKTTMADGSTNYYFNLSVGPTLNSNAVPHSYVTVASTDGKLTNSISFGSASLSAGKDSTGASVTYTPSLTVGPAGLDHP